MPTISSNYYRAVITFVAFSVGKMDKALEYTKKSLKLGNAIYVLALFLSYA